MASRTIIKYLGGFKTVAAIVQRDASSVSRWRALIPAKHQQKLLNYARDHGIDLRPEDFFYPERLQTLMQEQRPPITKICKSSGVENTGETLQP
ncbi:hypothetical protein MCU_00245 [Bartonella elizabethae Re6043vi]|uniref:Uncharacterized protein n=1 Tax=Bartonella elizabethae Re6043vi TaxID=1094554 RepID=A0ABN0GM54_BAREL|nr:hypothetical protein [Bartonella elizabethae]EJF84667.1 hypothetical protein MCU_00245 [Bartonella elizabethae Re6043vi]VEJ41449.1 Uncharacterised protein [Bartonella elizabethae]